MKIISAWLLLVCVFASAAAQKGNGAARLESMVATERAFSRMSEEKGTRESFLEFIAEDGILFRPKPVFGKKWMQEHPLPQSATRPLLTWQPNFAAISRAGDMGYTTGPWHYKNDIKDKKPSAFGNFMTVWKRQADGKWKFVVDLGMSNPEPKTRGRLVYGKPASGRFTGDAAKARTDLLSTEREFSRASAERGAVEAFLAYASTDVRVFRNQKQPFIGRKFALAALTPLTIEWIWSTTFADVSASGDLGYSYGIYELRDKSKASSSETGNYMRVWKRIGGAWKLILDLTDPLSPETKN